MAVHISIPKEQWDKMQSVCEQLGYTKRGSRWTLIDLLFDYAAVHPELFRKR